MKKIFYIVLAIVVVGIYSCQKDHTVTPASKSLSNGISVKGKKDTSPPDPTFNTLRVKKDTSPPDPKFSPSVAKKDTSPPDPKRL